MNIKHVLEELEEVFFDFSITFGKFSKCEGSSGKYQIKKIENLK